MPRLLVLGAGGFLGRSFADYVSGHGGAEVILHYRSTEERSAVGGSHESPILDLVTCTSGAFAELVDDVAADVVVNCTGLIRGRPDELRAANVDVVVRLIDELDGRRGVHLVHFGSAAEYGPQPHRRPVAEATFACPEGTYGITKLEATERLMQAAGAGRISATVLRLFNPIGRLSPPSTLPGNAARKIEEALRTGAEAINLGALDSWRDYIDVRDIARAVLAATARIPQFGAVLNVGRGEAVGSMHLVTTLAAIAGYHGEIVEGDLHSDRSAHVDWQCADVEAIHTGLGWSAEYSIEDSLGDLWSGNSKSTDLANV